MRARSEGHEGRWIHHRLTLISRLVQRSPGVEHYYQQIITTVTVEYSLKLSGENVYCHGAREIKKYISKVRESASYMTPHAAQPNIYLSP